MNNSIYKKFEGNEVDIADGIGLGFGQLAHIKKYLILYMNRAQVFDMSKAPSRKCKTFFKELNFKKELLSKSFNKSAYAYKE